MLEPEIIARLEQRHGQGCVVSVGDEATVPATTVTLRDGAIYGIRRLTPREGWIGRITRDDRVRAWQLAASGLFRSPPGGVSTPVADALRIEDRYILIEHQHRSIVLTSPAEFEQVVVAQARLHSAFSGFPARLTSGLGLCPVGTWLTLYAPKTVEAEPETPAMIAAGWERIRNDLLDVWSVVEPGLVTAATVVDALRELPATILHGNPLPENISIDDSTTVLGDWTQAVRGPGALDLGCLLVSHAGRLPLPVDDAIACYQGERARLGRLPSSGEGWERELRLGLTAGLMRYGWMVQDKTEIEGILERLR